MKRIMLIAGPILAAVVGWTLSLLGHDAPIAWTAAVVIWSAIWWVFEPVPIPVTSLLPIAIFPMVGVLDATQVGAAYGDSLVLLMMGGFMLSMAMEKSGTHRRIAVMMVRGFGGQQGGRKLVFGFMAASAFLSMWISNAATVLMLLPIVLAVTSHSSDAMLKKCLLLAVAYAASVGGIGTPIGTPPNLVFMRLYTESAGGSEPSFMTWMSWAMPIVLVMLPLMGFWLTRRLAVGEPLLLPEVGKWRFEEKATLTVFAITAALWITRKGPWGGWSEALGLTGANDASVALLSVIAMNIIPNRNGGKLLTWEDCKKIPWGVLILFGGGIAIARAFTASGLDQVLASSLSGLATIPTFLMIAAVCFAVTFLTEVTSNTATANLILPILAATAVAAGIDPKLVMFPAAISASFAFMLPVATPPNAIVFGSDQLTIREMAREGFVLNLLGVVVVAVISWMAFN
ncbi:MAG: SLC13/DASS family transporter [Rubripirellula sp.]|jgi:sodium-dependent dicarboxylate transporter 2/3/5|nr:SLC13/DASS family transporter [Rubripirellula sp.]